jgi:hypothetical protein
MHDQTCNAEPEREKAENGGQSGIPPGFAPGRAGLVSKDDVKVEGDVEQHEEGYTQGKQYQRSKGGPRTQCRGNEIAES